MLVVRSAKRMACTVRSMQFSRICHGQDATGRRWIDLRFLEVMRMQYYGKL